MSLWVVVAAVAGEEGVAKIVKGLSVGASEVPWHTTIMIKRGPNRVAYCTGTLVNTDKISLSGEYYTYVVTAASCVVEADVNAYRVFFLQSSLPTNMLNGDKVLSVTAHPEFVPGDGTHDVAVMRVTGLNNPNAGISLSSVGSEASPGERLTLAGYGEIISGVLPLVKMEDVVVSPDECGVYSAVSSASRIICTRSGVASACNVDNGGGLVRLVNVSGTIKLVLVGIVSGPACDPTRATMYASAYVNAEWLTSIMLGVPTMPPPSEIYTPVFQPNIIRGSNVAMAVGLGVGVPCGLLALVGAAVAVWFCCCRKKPPAADRPPTADHLGYSPAGHSGAGEGGQPYSYAYDPPALGGGAVTAYTA